MAITSLQVTNVGPIDDITLRFDPQVNVLTGPNNSGKSTLLWVLGELLVYPFTMPAKLFRSDQSQWSLSISSPLGDDSIDGAALPIAPEQLLHIYEKIGHTCYVPAQRHGTNFRSSGPTVSRDIDTYLDESLERFAEMRPAILRKVGPEAFRQFLRSYVSHQEPPELVRRRNLIVAGTSLVSDKEVKQKIIDLDYAAYRRDKPTIKAIVNQVASIASEITEGFPIRFMGVAEDSEGLYPQFRTPDGMLSLDVLSQGTQSIIHFLAHLLFGYAEYYDFPSDLNKKPGILIIDEIDAHLHPTWQRRIIPTLNSHFPNLQIFCSTHSPLMLAGLKTGQVQLLRRGENGKINASENESDIAGWTSDEILRQFMEVSNPTDVATAGRVTRLQELTREEKLSGAQEEELKQLRYTVRDDLLHGPGAAQVLQFAKELERAKGQSTRDALRSSGAQGSSLE